MGNSKKLLVAILIVEDEPLIRMGVVSQLEDAGFLIYEAGNADEAICRLEEHAEIRLVFTDINMPGSKDGLKLAHYARGRWPPVKIIVTSGQLRVRDKDLPAGAIFIGKPYHSEHITHKVREMIAGAAQAREPALSYARARRTNGFLDFVAKATA
jgi:two-component system, response regulator PdtaR